MGAEATTNLVSGGGGAEHESVREARPRERAFPPRNASLEQPHADDDKPQQRRPVSASAPTPLHPRHEHTRERECCKERIAQRCAVRPCCIYI